MVNGKRQRFIGQLDFLQKSISFNRKVHSCGNKKPGILAGLSNVLKNYFLMTMRLVAF